MTLRVDAQPIGKKLYRLRIFYDGQFIGEYERTQGADIERKKQEVECASDLLLTIYRSTGEFLVRWDKKRCVKAIRVNGVEVGQVPKGCWRRPSWEL